VRVDDEASRQLADGLAAIVRQFQVPGEFPAAVLAEADAAVTRPVVPGPDRRDARDLALITLDPAGATDLDQAFALSMDGDDVVLAYAIADVGFFVDRGSAIEAEAHRRGATIYLPSSKVTQYPPVLSEDAGSLLPGKDRPSVLLTVAVAPDGTATLRRAEHAVVRSRAQLAYETAGSAGNELPALLDELATRIAANEDARGANRIELPEQEVVNDPNVAGSLALVCRARNASEDQNSALSLAANLAVAKRMLDAHVGLFRVMPEPQPAALRMLHHTAEALGVTWPKQMTLHELDRTLDPTNTRHAAFALAARRAGGGATYATYATFEPDVVPWHAAVAATYAHATAPLRRLADRYVLDLVCLLDSGGSPSASDLASLAALAEIMERAETIQSHVDRAVLDMVEAVTLEHRVGEVFDAAIVDVEHGRDAARIQLADPVVVASLKVTGATPGEHVRVRLVSADPAAREVHFELVSTS
jgi:exoribonuclease R